MHDVITLDMNEKIHGANDKLARALNDKLRGSGVFTVNVMGAPGIGKTTTVIGLAEAVKAAPSFDRIVVIEGDIESTIDTERLRSLGIPAYQINTFGACHLDAPAISNAVTNIDLSESDLLLIENVGNLVCPAEFQIGEDIKLLICSVTEGSDKPYKYPLAFEAADIIALNKIDLLPHVDFDFGFFEKGVRHLNKKAKIIKTEMKNPDGYADLLAEISRLRS